jgi:RNA polymerase sigma factor FliA
MSLPRRVPEGVGPPLTNEQRKTANRLVPLVQRCAAELVRELQGRVKADELLGPGTLGLCDAVRGFRPDRHLLLEHYAKLLVRWRMLDFIRVEGMPLVARVAHAMAKAALEQAEREPFEIDLFADPEDLLEANMDKRCHDVLIAARLAGTLEAARPTVEDELGARREYQRSIVEYERALQDLSPEDRYIILSVYMEGRNLEEIAQELGVHYNTAQRRHAQALRRLGAALIARGVRKAPEPID